MAIAERDGVQLIIISMREHENNPHVQSNAMHALAVLAGTGTVTLSSVGFCGILTSLVHVDPVMHFHIGQLNAVAMMLAAMTLHIKVPEVQYNACRALANLALHGQ